MLSRAVILARRVAVRSYASSSPLLAEAAKPAASAVNPELVLNFATPVSGLVHKKVVKRVTLPGRDGAFGVERNSPALLSELRPGLVRVDFPDNTAEEYFIPGGFSFKHPNNVMDVSSPEGVKLDQIDVEALRQANAEAVKKRDAAAAGSKEAAEAKVVLEVYRALSQSLKVTL